MKRVLPFLFLFLLSSCTADFWGLPSASSRASTGHCVNPGANEVAALEVGELMSRTITGISNLKGPENIDLQYATCLAEAGSKYGQYALGTKYLFGQDVDQDYARAFKLFKKASKTEVHNTAIYVPGFGSVPASVQIINLAPPTPGITSAQFYIGLMYLEGLGVEQSDRKGRKWLKVAAKNNHQLAFSMLQGYFPEEFGQMERSEFK